jgi:hypothetical protein
MRRRRWCSLAALLVAVAALAGCGDGGGDEGGGGGGWQFDAIAVQAPDDPVATVFTTTAAD